MFSFKLRRATGATALALLPVAGLLAGCGSGGAGPASSDGRITVVTAFYPLQYAAEQIAGSRAEVTNLTKPGGEPHDLDLTPKDGAAIEQAGLVVYLKGFQPAVDQAIEQAGDAGSTFDVAGSAELVPLAAEARPNAEHSDEHSDEGGHEDGNLDPHFWLDPVRYAKVVDALGARLAEADPDHAQEYRDNAKTLHGKLSTLDAEFRSGLANCANKDLVTSHEAFGYLAARYGLEQVGIAGLSPDQEPSPAKQAEVAAFAREHEVHTIYYETLVDPDVAKSLAAETGAKVAVLDPLEGLTDASAGEDYPSVMRANLQTLRKGQPCT